MVGTFFWHSDCCGLDENMLLKAIEELIMNGVKTFYVGNQGNFDSMVLGCLSKLNKTQQQFSYSVVLAYPPTNNNGFDLYCGYSIYPEGLETVHPKYDIEKRNKWMIDRADYCLCYINHTWGGAYKFARQAKRRGLKVINMGSAEI